MSPIKPSHPKPALLALTLSVAVVAPAQAYIDPGTTSILLSPGVLLGIVYAGIALGCLQFKRGVGWVAGLVGLKREPNTPEPDEQVADSADAPSDDL